ncbi:bifunctional ligase/repressor BirA [Abditibacteriota bacterium]|nr:bifunctional ligase/repressor BirA [Abditibacteriota bacterium]
MRLAQTRRHFDEIDSTNTYAMNWTDAPDGALIVADSQTQGRGRLGRHWTSPPDVGLYFSLVLRDLAPEVKARLSLVVGLAVAQAVEECAEISVQIKWPNDVLTRDRKIGGILCEATPDRVVAGVGLNLNQREEQLPERPIFPASSLLLQTGRSFDRDAVLNALLASLELGLESADWPTQRAHIEARLYGRGDLVHAGNATGLLQGIGDDGALLVRTADGVVEVRSGEVEFF